MVCVKHVIGGQQNFIRPETMTFALFYHAYQVILSFFHFAEQCWPPFVAEMKGLSSVSLRLIIREYWLKTRQKYSWRHPGFPPAHSHFPEPRQNKQDGGLVLMPRPLYGVIGCSWAEPLSYWLAAKRAAAHWSGMNQSRHLAPPLHRDSRTEIEQIEQIGLRFELTRLFTYWTWLHT